MCALAGFVVTMSISLGAAGCGVDSPPTETDRPPEAVVLIALDGGSLTTWSQVPGCGSHELKVTETATSVRLIEHTVVSKPAGAGLCTAAHDDLLRVSLRSPLGGRTLIGPDGQVLPSFDEHRLARAGHLPAGYTLWAADLPLLVRDGPALRPGARAWTRQYGAGPAPAWMNTAISRSAPLTITQVLGQTAAVPDSWPTLGRDTVGDHPAEVRGAPAGLAVTWQADGYTFAVISQPFVDQDEPVIEDTPPRTTTLPLAELLAVATALS
ncbi:hypothetical protein F0L68_05210 [Solihabitans fulvus]|uniref:Uncharacterized protein n=1 Tax=Solihabitans fulvus TaxID=1892852 RepID=A0A5B2XQT3_9PSEU|nr:hypothetical protein [Solihabitans fulvus]KAA2265242.1 hypothetical protein F0L68_05210 [Solihabitans fulvus]